LGAHSSHISMSNNSLLDNVADSGGAVFLEHSSTVLLTGNTIRGNRAKTGGALSVRGFNSTRITMSSNEIVSNTATDLGGAIALARATLSAANDIIAGNTSPLEGIHATESTLSAYHWTLANNGDYALTTSSNSSATMVNTIVASHTVAGFWGPNIVADHTLFYDNGTPCGGGAVCTHNLVGNPDFVDPAVGNYHIGLGSAALDVGVDAGVTIDVDFDPRPQGSGFDIGADETGLVVRKRAYPSEFRAGERLTYTIQITNTTNVTLAMTVTDSLPSHVLPSGSLTWSSPITANGGFWSVQFPVTVQVGYVGVLTNEVKVHADQGIAGGSVITTTVQRFRVYLPLVLRDGPQQ